MKNINLVSTLLTLLFQIQTDIPFCFYTPGTIKIAGTTVNTQSEANCLGVWQQCNLSLACWSFKLFWPVPLVPGCETWLWPFQYPSCMGSYSQKMVKCILELSNYYADLTSIVGFESSIHQSMYTSLKICLFCCFFCVVFFSWLQLGK